MNKYFLLFLLFYMPECYAQNVVSDSIKALINKVVSDTEKINLYNELSVSFGEVNIDSSAELLKKTLVAAEKINYLPGKGEALRLLAADYAIKGDYAKAVTTLSASQNIIFALKDSIRIAKVFNTYGMIYGMQALYDSSMQCYRKAAGIFERNKDSQLLGSAYGNLAIGYQMQSDFATALTYQLKSLGIAEARNNLNSQAYTLMNIGNTYQNIGDTLRAEQALLKGIKIAKELGLKNVELYGYSNIATLYESNERFEESYKYARKSAELAHASGDAGIEAAGLSKAALALANMHEFLEAETLNRQAMNIADSSKQSFNIMQAYSNMGFIFVKEKKYTNAIPYFEKAVKLISASDRYDESTGKIYNDLSECYEKNGDFQKALQTFKISSGISDSIESKVNIRKSTELVLNNEFKKKEQINDAIQSRKNAEARLKQILLVCGLILAIIVAAAIFFTLKNKQKANGILLMQKEEIQSALSQLKITQSQLIQSEKMASLGELTAGIAHEIQNPLNFVNNFSEVSNELLDEMKNELKAGNNEEAILLAEDVKQNLEKIIHHGMRADDIVKNMLQHSGRDTEQKELTDINALCDEYLRLSYHGLRAKEKSFTSQLETHFDPDAGSIKIVPQDIGRVLLNLFNNAFYAVSDKKKIMPESYDPLIIVCTKKINSLIEIRIKDNGGGIPQKILDKIYQPFFTTKPAGKGTGLGLSLSYDIINAHNGNIKVETQEGYGAEFIIELPVIL